MAAQLFRLALAIVLTLVRAHHMGLHHGKHNFFDYHR